MNSAEDIASILSHEFSTLAFAHEMFPMLTDWGVKDEHIYIHSLGCNYLSALGRHAGFWAMNEFPVRIENGRYIRPDVVWWARDSGDLGLVGEFERFVPGQERKLFEKARNLMETYQALGRRPLVLLLMAWTVAGTDLSGTWAARSVAFEGCQLNGGERIPGLESTRCFVQACAVFGQLGNEQRLLSVQL